MKLSDEHIQSFITCWTKDFGVVLTPEEAQIEAMRLLDFFGQFAEGLTRIRRPAQADKETPLP
ncbi:MAG: hypothetical protein ACRELE_04695 [Gemmatimonadales bacterium]